MRVVIFCGKGGVGKTISATSLSVFLAQKGERTLLIDCDGGHNAANTLGIRDAATIPTNTIQGVEPCLSIVVIDHPTYKNALQIRAEGIGLDRYFEQFPGHLGLVALADALMVFFGVPIDIPTLHKFAVLIEILSGLGKQEFTHVILDVEPTAGLERLLSHAGTMIRTLQNLRRRGPVLFASIVLRWQDVGEYISGEYFEHIEEYSKDIMSAVAILKKAAYILVCTPERGPITQMFEVREIIRRFGGKTYGYVVNNVRDEAHEKQSMTPLNSLRMPRVLIPRRNDLHTGADTHPILFEIGKTLHDGLWRKSVSSRR